MARAILKWLLATGILFGLLLVSPATPPGRMALGHLVERLASAEGRTVTVEGLSGWPPFAFDAAKVTVSGTDGPFIVVEEVSAKLRPVGLLSGTIAIKDLSAGRVVLNRIPEAGENGDGGGTAVLPFSLERFAVNRLDVSEAVAGQAAVLKLSGHASAGIGGAIALTLDAERIDGRVGLFEVALSRTGAGIGFSMDLTAREAENGLLAALMGQAGGPAYGLRAVAGPDGDAMRGSVTLSSSQSAEFNGAFTLTPENGATRIAARGEGRLAELVPPSFADVLSGAIEIAIDADWAGAGEGASPRLSIREGTMRTAAINGRIEGRLTENLADLTIALDLADPKGNPIRLPIPAVQGEIGALSLNGKVVPSGENVRLDLVGRITALEVAGVAVPAAGLSFAIETASTNPLEATRLPFAFRAEADAIRTENGEVAALTGTPILFSADGAIETETRSAPLTATLSFPEGHMRFEGRAAAATTGNLTVDIADLTPLTALFGRTLAGTAAASAEGAFFGAGGTDLALTASLARFDPGIARLRRLIGGDVHAEARLTSTPDRSLTVSSVVVESSTINTSGQLEFANGGLNAALTGSVPDLSALTAEADGSATFEARARGALPYPSFELAFLLAEGSIRGTDAKGMRLQLEGGPEADGLSAILSLQGTLADASLSGSADATVTPTSGRFALPRIEIAFAQNRARGALSRAADGMLTGAISLDMIDLEALAALGGMELQGSAKGDARFEPGEDTQAIVFDISASELASGAVAVGSFQASGRIDDAFGAPLFAGDVTAQSVSSGNLVIDRLSASAEARDGATGFNLLASGDSIDLRAGGIFQQEAATPVIRLDTVSGSAFNVPLELAGPVTLRLEDGQPGALAATLAVGDGRIAIEKAAGDGLDIGVTATALPASFVNGLRPGLAAKGTIEAHADVTGSFAVPEIAWALDWSGLSLAQTESAGLPPLVLSANGNATKTATTLSGDVTGGGIALRVAGDVPFSGQGLNVNVTGNVPLGLVAARSAREIRAAGAAGVNLGVTGAFAAPRISGHVDIADATVIDSETGFGISGAAGRIELAGRRASTSGITGGLSQGGTVTVAGGIELSGERNADLTIRIAEGRYNDGRIVNAAFNADLAVRGPILGGGVLSGSVVLGRTEIRLPDRLGGAATAIDVTHLNAPRDFTPPSLRERSAAAGTSVNATFRLDVSVTNSGTVFVRGFGVDAVFGGSLNLAGTLSNPEAAGSFEMIRGRIELIGKRFDLVEGRLTFTGSLVPVLDFTAAASVTGAEVQVLVTGAADNPSVTFTSTPQLPEEEILSRLLFDRQISGLSPIQAAQLVDAAAQLSGVGGGQSLFSRVRQTVGLDDLDIRQNSAGGTTVGIGARINENVRLGVETGTNAREGRVTIDLGITDSLKARGEADASGSGRFGLSFEREY